MYLFIALKEREREREREIYLGEFSCILILRGKEKTRNMKILQLVEFYLISNLFHDTIIQRNIDQGGFKCDIMHRKSETQEFSFWQIS